MRLSLPPAVIAALILAPVPAMAGDGIRLRPDDTARLEALDRAAGAALREALGDGTAQQAADAADALRGAAADDYADPGKLAGEWSCRMTKIGGVQPSVTYPPFRCRFSGGGGSVSFEKLTGSQRTKGAIHRIGDAWVYAGASFVQGEQPQPYADFPDEMDTRATETLPDVGVLEVLDDNHARILFPLPYRESVLNVLTLSR